MNRKHKTRPSKDFPKEEGPRFYPVRLIPGGPHHPTRILTRKAGWRILEYRADDPATHPYPGDGVPHWYPHFIAVRLIEQDRERSFEFNTIYAEVSRRVALGLLPQSAKDDIDEKIRAARLTRIAMEPAA